MTPSFSDEALARIRKAVTEAETKTAGEIVPYLVPASARYDVAVWRGASLTALLSVATASLIFQFYEGWGLAWLFSGWGTGLLALLGGSLGAVAAASIPALKRLLTGEALMIERTHQRAMQAFVEEEVFNTRDRTGILLFVSLFEHRIEVLGDEGINRRVSADQWVRVVETLREGIVQNNMTDGFVRAIAQCGDLLAQEGVAIRPDDTNELGNDLRLPAQ